MTAVFDEIRPVEMSVDEIKEAMRRDCVTFLAVYIQDELTLEVPALHEEIWAEFVRIIDSVNLDTWNGHIQKLFCVPRGHAKSTLTKLAVILFLRYSKLSFALYASLTKPISTNACKDIVAWLRSPQDEQIYGPTEMHQANDNLGIWKFTIYLPNGSRKLCILKSLGTDQQVRGTLIDNKRPQLMVFDDCEDNETALTPESQAKLDTWLMGNALKASARNSVRIILGNMINSRTMLYRFSKDPAWNPTVYGAIIRDKKTKELVPLWPGMHSVESLIAEYRDYRSKGVGHVWVYEMMNMTMDTVFKTSMSAAVRLPRPTPDQVTAGIICVDPAFGLKSIHDQAALTVHVKFEGSGIPHIVDSRIGRWNEDQMLDNILELSYYWNLSTWGIESVAAQKLLLKLFVHMLKDRGIEPGIFSMIPLPSGGTAKSSRILALANSVSMGNYGIADEENELFLEIESYDPHSNVKKDDLPDSAAYGPIAWGIAGEQIKDALRYKQALALIQAKQDRVTSIHQSQFVPF